MPPGLQVVTPVPLWLGGKSRWGSTASSPGHSAEPRDTWRARAVALPPGLTDWAWPPAPASWGTQGLPGRPREEPGDRRRARLLSERRKVPLSGSSLGSWDSAVVWLRWSFHPASAPQALPQWGVHTLVHS